MVVRVELFLISSSFTSHLSYFDIKKKPRITSALIAQSAGAVEYTDCTSAEG